jgi:hypothetical protein
MNFFLLAIAVVISLPSFSREKCNDFKFKIGDKVYLNKTTKDEFHFKGIIKEIYCKEKKIQIKYNGMKSGVYVDTVGFNAVFTR